MIWVSVVLSWNRAYSAHTFEVRIVKGSWHIALESLGDTSSNTNST